MADGPAESDAMPEVSEEVRIDSWTEFETHPLPVRIVTWASLGPEQAQAMRDSIVLLFYDQDFEVAPVEIFKPETNRTIESVKARIKTGFDAVKGSMLEVLEVKAKGIQDGESCDWHVVSVDWDNGDGYEVDLLANEITRGDRIEPVSDEIQTVIKALSNLVDIV